MRLAVIALALGLGGAASAAEGPWGLAPLMAELQAVKEAHAHFTERKTSALLTQPIEASGTLSYVAPSSLEKITLAPQPERIVLKDDRLTGTEPNGEPFSVSVRDHPEIGALVEGLRSTLAGDLPTLSRYYAIALEGTRDDWHLSLTPVDKAVRDKVDAIRIDGTGASLRRISVREHDGDRSDMVVTPDPS
jgi:outer membrane lipoprotein-sorting protein